MGPWKYRFRHRISPVA